MTSDCHIRGKGQSFTEVPSKAEEKEKEANWG